MRHGASEDKFLSRVVLPCHLDEYADVETALQALLRRKDCASVISWEVEMVSDTDRQSNLSDPKGGDATSWLHVDG